MSDKDLDEFKRRAKALGYDLDAPPPTYPDDWDDDPEIALLRYAEGRAFVAGYLQRNNDVDRYSEASKEQAEQAFLLWWRNEFPLETERKQ